MKVLIGIIVAIVGIGCIVASLALLTLDALVVTKLVGIGWPAILGTVILGICLIGLGTWICSKDQRDVPPDLDI